MEKDLHDINTAVDFYDQRYIDGYMEEWDEAKKEKVEEIIASLSLPTYGKVLDFGCGNGVFTNIIKKCLPTWEVFGVEISDVAVYNARKKFPSCTFLTVSDAAAYTHAFDFLFSHHVIEHVQNLSETFDIINNYLKPKAFQLHIMPCGNEGSYEYNICIQRINGIEKDKENRFFFEEDGHLRRLTSADFVRGEQRIGFSLKKEYYANQYYGALNWITKSSPSFVKRLTDSKTAKDVNSAKKLKAMQSKLLPLTYLQFPYSKYWQISKQWRKTPLDYLKLSLLFFPAIISKLIYFDFDKKARNEWAKHKTEKNGSEMYLFFER